MYERSYTLSPVFFLFRDSVEDARLERLAFHIEQGDYFPFLATVLGFLKETVEGSSAASDLDRAQAAFAGEMREDLLYLQEHYRIVPAEKPVPYTRAKMVRF